MIKKLFTIWIALAAALAATAQLTPANQGGKWGFRNGSGNWVVKPQFQAVDRNATFSQSRKYATVKLNDKWGIIDVEGKYIIKPMLRDSRTATAAGNEWQKTAKQKTGLYDAFDLTQHKWGMVNCNGQFVVAPVYDDIDAENTFYAGKEYAIVKYMGQWGAIGKDGYYITKPYLTSLEDIRQAAAEAIIFSPVGENIYCAYDPDVKKYGFVNNKGNWVFKPGLANIDKGYTFSQGRPFAVVKLGNGWGCLNRRGKFVVRPTFQDPAAARTAAYKIPGINAKVPASEVANADDGKHKASVMQGAKIRITDGSTGGYAYGGGSTGGTAVKAPTLRIISPRDGGTYDQQTVVINYEAKTFDGSQPQILAYVNGELMSTKGVRRTGNQISVTLPRSTGNVSRIQLIAKDGRGQNSDPAVVALRYVGAEGKPGLHLLAVGVSDYNQADLKLQNAAKDANDFVNTIKGLGLKQYDRIASATVITDKEATDRNIKKNLTALVNKVNQGDVVMLFFSGHGAKEGDDTYFLSVNAESNDLFSTAVNFDDIKGMTRRLKDKKCRILLFMDACHSGALYGTKGVAENYSLAEPGVIGFYSSTESQKSNESEKWANGIFTKSLIEGLKGKAADAEGNITLDGLERYIREAVRTATHGTQMPIFENKQGNFVLFNKK